MRTSATNYKEKMDNPLVLTFDFGTQSLRISFIDTNGDCVAQEKFRYEPAYFSTSYGYAEQNPEYYWDSAFKTLKILCSKNKSLLKHIIGAALTTFRDTSVQLDDEYKPVRPCILWLDQRLAKGKEKLPLWHWAAYRLIGMTQTIIFNRARAVVHWLKENEPDSWNKTYKYVNISTYLNYKLTGNLIDSSASMIGHYPIDFKKRKWYRPNALKARMYGIPKRMLCDLVQPGEILGTIKEDIAKECGLPSGIKLYATGSDKACETIGLGALNKDTAAISYGTASTVEASNTKYCEPEPFLPAYPAAIPGWYNLDVQIYRGYWMLTWFSEQFAGDLTKKSQITKSPIEEILDADLKNIPPGSNGLIVQPYWGPGLSRPLARGAVIGFSDIHTRAHLYRAIIEGIAYALREGLEGIEKRQGHKVSKIRISGGGSQSDDICQITSDIFGLEVSRVQTYETSSLGAAMCVFLATKHFNNIDEATAKMVRKTKTFYPNAIAQQEYDYLYKNAYTKMYPQLKNIYKDINSFSKRGL